MAQTLRLKRSSVPGRVPTTATLQTGEIAINTADGLVYIRKDDDSIIPLLGANTTVTGSVVLLGSIEATSFTGSFSGSFNGPIVGTLSKTVGSGDGIVNFLFDGSNNVTVTLDTGSAHFRNAVIDLIDTNAPSIVAQDTTGAGGIDLTYNSETGVLSGSLVNSQITIGESTVALGQTLASIFNVDITGSFKGNAELTGSFRGFASGSFVGTLDGLATQAVSASHALKADTATTASYAVVTTTSSYAQTSTSASHAVNSDLAVTASYSLVATSASYASTSTSASHAVNSDLAVTASYASTSTSASHALYADASTSASYASFASTAEVALNVQTGSLIETGSIFNATITLTKADRSSFDLTVNNVASSSYAATSTSASHAIYADSSSISVSASHAANADSSISASYATTASYAAFAANLVGFSTGSFMVTGSVANSTLRFTKGDDSTFDLTVNNVSNATSASYALYAANVINPNTGSFVITGSVSDATLTFTKADETTFQVTVDNVTNAVSASYAATASSADDFLVRGDLTVDGIVTAREFHTQFVSASVIYQSGSTKFGDTADDTHEFTGSVLISGSIDSDDITIDDWGSVSGSLAAISASATSITLQSVTDNGNNTTLVISASNLNITGFPDVSASLAELYDTSASFASELTLVSATASAAYNYTLQDITDNGNSTTLVISSSNLNITGFPDVSASLAAISASAANAGGLTLQQVTDNGNVTTNQVIISSSLNVSSSIYSKGEEVLDFAVAMAIALG